MTRRKEEELMSAYVSDVENSETAQPVAETTPFREEAKIVSKSESNDYAKKSESSDFEEPVVERKTQKYKDNLGYLKIPVNTLPTLGLFYPDGLEISIRAARGEEIKHWSTMNDQDLVQLSKTDDILNYMIEKCVSVKNPLHPGNCWKDLKNVDRFYLLLAVKEFTFINGENELMVPLSEGNEIPVVKEMINFINIPEKLMKFYNNETKAFRFDINGFEINMYIPSIGVNAWLKEYATKKSNAQERFDQDFIQFAPMLIKDFRDLNVPAYEELVASTRLWGVKEWSVVSHVSELLSEASKPKIQIEEGGEEIPLTFRGGIRSIFLLPDPILDLR